MARRMLFALVGGTAGIALSIVVTAATGWNWVFQILGIGGALGAVAVAERRGWVKSREEINKPTVLFPSERR